MTALPIPERRGQPPYIEPAAPAVLRIAFDPDEVARACEQLAAPPAPVVAIDVAAAARAADPAPRTHAPRLDAMEYALLEAAKRSAAGDRQVPPRRDLIAVALREAEREQAFRDDAEARAVALTHRLRETDETVAGLLEIQRAMLTKLGAIYHCEPTISAVFAQVSAAYRAVQES